MSEQNKESEPGKVAIVTGGNRGIGGSTVNPKRLLDLEGAAVLIVSLAEYRWDHRGSLYAKF
jgi:NAD(P)-dependent dehydrogenase (short-subunit alcohol dehydrogenase family)